LLLALGVGLVTVLMGSLRMLLRSIGVLFAFGVVALAMVFGSRTVRFSCVLVVLRSLVVLISGHARLLGCFDF
jgi:hypothetical protein